jgi:hypothetical protein
VGTQCLISEANYLNTKKKKKRERNLAAKKYKIVLTKEINTAEQRRSWWNGLRIIRINCGNTVPHFRSQLLEHKKEKKRERNLAKKNTI